MTVSEIDDRRRQPNLDRLDAQLSRMENLITDESRSDLNGNRTWNYYVISSTSTDVGSASGRRQTALLRNCYSETLRRHHSWRILDIPSSSADLKSVLELADTWSCLSTRESAGDSLSRSAVENLRRCHLWCWFDQMSVSSYVDSLPKFFKTEWLPNTEISGLETKCLRWSLVVDRIAEQRRDIVTACSRHISRRFGISFEYIRSGKRKVTSDKKSLIERNYFIFRSVCGTPQFAGSSGPVPYTFHVFNGVKLVFRLSLSLPRKIVMITFMHCKAVVRIKLG